MMKLAVSSAGDNITSPIDPRFGRCAYFVIVEVDEDEAIAVPNPGAALAQGAGIQAAQLLASHGVNVVISGNFGPNAFQALQAAGIDAYVGASGSVRDAVTQFSAGKLQHLTGPTTGAHSGMVNPPNSGFGFPGGGFGRGRGRGGGRFT